MQIMTNLLFLKMIIFYFWESMQHMSLELKRLCQEHAIRILLVTA
ncbi:hypothetical protein DVH24_000136 [Malus domestica]|uniref:Uncharacterized protein n=1 Tax=Malus domestica TaxID=3750 RepID=A0A498J1U4_MALDO|nr:hypothetical protein DVH24_000136 [Malus domestica]